MVICCMYTTQDQHNMILPAWTQDKTYEWDGKNVTVFDLLMSLQTWEFDLKYGEPAQKAKLRGGEMIVLGIVC